MISDELQEAWRNAARDAMETPALIKEMGAPPPEIKPGGRPLRNVTKQRTFQPTKIQKNRFSAKITKLMNQFSLDDKSILDADLTERSDSDFVQELYRGVNSTQRANKVVAKSLLIGLDTVRKTFALE